MPFEDNKKDAEKCIDIALKAFSFGHLAKAERLTLKAERLYPTARAKVLLAKIQGWNRSKSTSEDTSSDSNFESDSKSGFFQQSFEKIEFKMEELTAEKCFEIAHEAFFVRDFDRAERFLLKAERLKSSEHVQALLGLVRARLNESEKKERVIEQPEPSSAKFGNDLKDAEKSIEIAIDALSSGNLAKAERFLAKADRICSNTRAKDLLQQVRTIRSYDKSNKNNENCKTSIRINVSSGNITIEEPIQKESTAEQLEAIRHVKESKDDYEILGVPKGASRNVVKKAHRRLTLLLHPDKNRAPGAKEAFMTVTEASERLQKLAPKESK